MRCASGDPRKNRRVSAPQPSPPGRDREEGNVFSSRKHQLSNYAGEGFPRPAASKAKEEEEEEKI